MRKILFSILLCAATIHATAANEAQHIELADEIAEDDCAVAGHWSLNLKRSPEMPCADSAVAAGALAHRVLDVLVTQVGLQGTRIGALVASG